MFTCTHNETGLSFTINAAAVLRLCSGRFARTAEGLTDGVWTVRRRLP